MTSTKKIVAVLGATGTQGSSVVDALLAKGTYTVRALTRNTTSSASKALAVKGVETMQADLADKASLVSAFKSAYAVFGVTMPFTDTTEEAQGRNIVDACKECNVELLVWSSLPNASVVSGGKYTKVKHWDEKAAVDVYIKKVGQPAVILQLGNFSENLVNYHQLRPSSTEPGSFDFVLPIIRPEQPVAHTWVGGDLGHVVRAIIDNWEDPQTKAKLTKQAIPMCSFTISGEKLVSEISRITGKTVRYVKLDTFEFGGEEMTQMFHLVDDGMDLSGVTFPPAIFMEIGVKFSTVNDFVEKVLAPVMNK